MSKPHKTKEELEKYWKEDPRWRGVERPYSAEEVLKLRPSLHVENSLARAGADSFWNSLSQNKLVNGLGAVTGAQAVQMVRAGLSAVYVSGWQVAADNNQASQTYPDQSLYPCNSVPELVKRINNALLRADQIEKLDDKHTDWLVPIVADAEAGFGGPLHAFEIMKSMVEAGASGVHFEDQLASEKKCGHLGGKVLVPTAQFIRTLIGARLASDVLDVPTLLIARTDAQSATLITSDIDERDHQFFKGERTEEGYYHVNGGVESCIARGLAYAPYCDLLWMETSTPNLEDAKAFAEAIRAKHPGKLLAYNCSPSFNWKEKLDEESIAIFREELAKMGFLFQFITLAGWHSLNYGMYNLAKDYDRRGMSAYVDLQQAEFAKEKDGYTATKHQREAGTSYFDKVLNVVTQGKATTSAYKDSTENQQFNKKKKAA